MKPEFGGLQLLNPVLSIDRLGSHQLAHRSKQKQGVISATRLAMNVFVVVVCLMS